jgi:hypothetical protein
VATLCAEVLAGCSTSQTSGVDTPPSPESPVQKAMAWFQAVTSKDAAAARVHFAPKQMGMMDWMNGDTSQWPVFSVIHCRTTAQAGADAAVNCTFNESQPPATGNPDSFWNVSMVRGPAGTWLSDDYGQG